MNLDDTPSQAEFRAQARAWLSEHRHESPPIIRGLHVDDPAPYREWQGKLARAGLVGVTWPAQYGGGGLGPSEEMIAGEEIARAGCAQIVDHIAIGELGPTIIAYGTEDQKERYVGRMLLGIDGWCQLFSEPGAGSDLAGVTTRAKRTDEGWVLNGQKVWTTLAQAADFGLLLARTDPEVPKHKGLTMFIVPMDAPGVTVRPLRLMSGSAPFNEIFFDDVGLADDAVVGPVNGGWGVSITTLMYERLMALAAFEHMSPSPEALIAPLLDSPALEDGNVRRRIAELTVDRLALRYTAYRALSDLEGGRMPGPESGLGKIGVVEAGRKAAALIAEVLGPDALEGEWGELAAEMPGMRSAGGTEEILRNTIGERVLGLPSEPRVDKGVPFSELTRGVNFSLTDEQLLLREAAVNALSRIDTIAGARAALDGAPLPDVWPTAREAGWTGLLVPESHGGAELNPFDAMLVLEQCGRRLTGAGLIGHLAATLILAQADHPLLPALAAGEQRAAVAWAPDFQLDLPGADWLVVRDGDGAGLIAAGDVTVEPVIRFDATRPLGHARLNGGAPEPLDVDAGELEHAWHVTQGLLAADALGVAEAMLEMSVSYAKDRHAFGRPIGSYQAIKQQIVEILRHAGTTRSLCFYAGYAAEARPDELALAASAARFAAEEAADYASRTCIAVHGGIGATWEHDAHLYWRRAQLSRLLLGGVGDAGDRVAEQIIERARSQAVKETV